MGNLVIFSIKLSSSYMSSQQKIKIKKIHSKYWAKFKLNSNKNAFEVFFVETTNSLSKTKLTFNLI